MHRRAVLEISRRQGVDLSCTVRFKPIAFTPVPVATCRRSFRSYPAVSNSSENPSSTDAAESDGAAPRPFGGSKFGNRWGSKASKPAGLSAAELASREALLKSNPPPQPEVTEKPVEQPTPRQPASRDTLIKSNTTPPQPQVTEKPAEQSTPRQENDQPRWTIMRHDRPAKSRVSNLEIGNRIILSNSVNPKIDREERPPKWTMRSATAGAQPAPRGLSAAESASREALLSSRNPPTPQSTENGENMRRSMGRSGNGVEQGGYHDASSNSGIRHFVPTKTHEPSSKRPSNIIEVPPHLRKVDWTCPTCQFLTFGRNLKCPCCHTIRPELDIFSSEKTGTPENKFRKLGQSIMSEWDQGNQNSNSSNPSDREKALELDQLNKERRLRRSQQTPSEGDPQLTKLEVAQRRHQLHAKHRDDAEKQVDTKSKGEKPDEPTWTWDTSYLEKLKLQEEEKAEKRKEFKQRRPGRKQRGSEEEDDGFDGFDEKGGRRRDKKRSTKQKGRQKELDTAPSPLYLPEFISVSNLADVIGVRPAQFVQRMEEMGFENVTNDHILDAETAGLVAAEFNFEPIFEDLADDYDLTAAPEPEDKSSLPPRPPVVTIMGHVDHGKTTILDWLRHSSIAASEHGGITQHIGAFSVPMPSGQTITFLDTPGHSAFLEMRRRGADVTDIVVLVVAADDSVKPQTVEAIKHATQAKVPVIVAISKMDKENVNPERVKQDLSVHGIHVEDYGGDVQAIPVSGKTGQGMLELEEAIIALSEMLDHRADTTGNAEGWVIESTTKSYGRVTSALIRRGTLRPGDVIVAGTAWARVRTLRNEAGVPINEATPGMPVQIDGWREQPEAGSEILQAPSEQKAKDVVAYRLEKSETQKMSEDMAAINESRRELLEKRKQEEEADNEEGATTPTEQEPSGPKPIHFIIKADVAGSAEALQDSISAIGNNEVYPNILRASVGPVSEFDIEHAASANGHIISFNMPIDPSMSRMAELRRVNLMDHNIIYKLIDDVKATLSEHLAPNVTHRVTGEAEVGQIFEITMKGKGKVPIAGCKVRNGVIDRVKKVRVMRGQEIIYDGYINSLKNVKKDVTEMRKDTECGIGFDDWTEFAVGDHIQCYEEIFEKRYL